MPLGDRTLYDLSMPEEFVQIGNDAAGTSRLLPIADLIESLHGGKCRRPQDLTTLFDIPETDWIRVQTELAGAHRAARKRESDVGTRHRELNRELRELAFGFPPYSTENDLDLIQKHMGPPLRQRELESALQDLVLRPATRARMLVGRFEKLVPFDQFAYVIDSAYFAYCRGNVVASFMCILPVIEGVIVRWAEDVGGNLGKGFPGYADWVSDTPVRAPLLANPLFADSYAETCGHILSAHLYKKTQEDLAFGLFNRHIALHLKEERGFATPQNLVRAFLLLDLMSELLICERWDRDPMFHVTPEEEGTLRDAYQQAAISQLTPPTPENALFRHKEYRF